MIRIDNCTNFPYALFERMTSPGLWFDVLVVKGTFAVCEAEGQLCVAPEQDPINIADDYSCLQDSPCSIARSLFIPTDLTVFKPGTDVLIQGHAHAPNGQSKAKWPVEIRVGDVQKRFEVTGMRSFERHRAGWGANAPVSTQRVPLDYSRSFGGYWSGRAATAPLHHSDVEVWHQDNPVGQGWIPDVQQRGLDRQTKQGLVSALESVKVIHAPQLVPLNTSFPGPTALFKTVGVGPVAGWWRPRRARCGTTDRVWREKCFPALPDDFDFRFNQVAPPDQVTATYLRGNEPLKLSGLLAIGDVETHLPGLAVLVRVERAQRLESSLRPLRLDTVWIDTDRQTVALTWRIRFLKDERVTGLQPACYQIPVSH